MNRRDCLLAGVAIGVVSALLPLVMHVAPALVWNTTASAPVGLYRTALEPHPRIGDLVFVRPPVGLADWLARAGYLPHGALLLKRIAAIPPSTVCRVDAVVTVNGRRAAVALDRDRLGRPLPSWGGCRRLSGGDVFVLNTDPGSLDSRYFGPLPAADIVATARLLLVAEAGADAR